MLWLGYIISRTLLQEVRSNLAMLIMTRKQLGEVIKERGYSSSLELTIPYDTRIVMKRHRVNWKRIDSFRPIVKYLSKLKLRSVFHVVKALSKRFML